MRSTDETSTFESCRSDFCNDGFVVIPDYLSPPLLTDVAAEWEQFQSSARPNLLCPDEPAAVFWRHVPGEKKRVRPLREFPELQALAFGELAGTLAKELAIAQHGSDELRLLETIVFSKPPRESGLLCWHQDVAFFPFDPQNQIALWIPLDPVDEDNGGLEYAVGSHRAGLSCPIDLHSGQKLGDAPLDPVPADPRKLNYEIRSVILSPGGLAAHDGRTWHRSLPNRSETRQRRAVSLRYLVGETRYQPRPGTAASMNVQANAAPGDVVDGPAFPRI